MGGAAFDPTAERLTSPQFADLVAYCRSKLATVFVPPVEYLYYVEDKKTHGDLDLLCGHTICEGGFLKGAEAGKLDREGNILEDQLQIGQGKQRLVGTAVKAVKRQEEEERAIQARAMCHAAAKAIGAIEWKRFGNELCTRLPCDRLYPDMDPQKHYQVDMVLLPPESVQFCLFTTSYSSTLPLLASSLFKVSKALVLHGSRLNIKHSPFPGFPAITCHLTTDSKDFCTFFGLDYERWLKGGFKNEEQVWEWLIDVPEDAVLGRAWKYMANRGGAQVPRAHKGKGAAFTPFNEMLKNSKWRDADKEVKEVEVTMAKPVLEKEGGAGSPTLTASTAGSGSPSSSITRETDIRIMSPAHSVLTSYSVQSNSTAPTSVDTSMIPPILDPEQPCMPNEWAMKALEFFGVMSDWETQLEALKVEVRERVEAAKVKEAMKEENRRLAREYMARAAEQKEAEGEGVADVVEESVEESPVAV